MNQNFIMKKIIVIPACCLFIALAACNNSDKSRSGPKASQVDSLYKAVLKEHNEGMAGWMEIEGRQKQIKNLLDSIAALPSKTQSLLESFKTKLNEATKELGVAYEEMNHWMTRMNLDSARDDLKQRFKYLMEEKERGNIVTTLINNNLQKADSLLKTKF
jgi:hypothetical protein